MSFRKKYTPAFIKVEIWVSHLRLALSEVVSDPGKIQLVDKNYDHKFKKKEQCR